MGGGGGGGGGGGWVVYGFTFFTMVNSFQDSGQFPPILSVLDMFISKKTHPEVALWQGQKEGRKEGRTEFQYFLVLMIID